MLPSDSGKLVWWSPAGEKLCEFMVGSADYIVRLDWSVSSHALWMCGFSTLSYLQVKRNDKGRLCSALLGVSSSSPFLVLFLLNAYLFHPFSLSPSPSSPSPFPLFPFPLSPFPLFPFPLSPFPLSPFPLFPFPLSPFPLFPFPLSPFPLFPFPLSPFPLSPFLLSPFLLPLLTLRS